MSEKRLLVIDDDEPILGLIAAIGESCGLSVQATSVPKEFLEVLETNPPDIIVLDLVMPKFDGIEVLKRMNDQQIKSRIMLISGADESLLERASKLAAAWGLNMLAAFTKPLDPKKIEAAFREVISQD
jgi:CheY-like chemotaxis protein